jgi:hypothetical protein
MTATYVASSNSLFPNAPAGAQAPDSASALRKARMKSFRASHGWVWPTLIVMAVVGVVLLLVVPILGAVLLVAALVTTIVIYVVQAGKAKDEFFTAYATARGLSCSDRGRINSPAPLLQKGDKRQFHKILSGPICDDDGQLGTFTYTDVSTDSEGNRQETDYHFTVLHLPLPGPVADRFAGVYCREKGFLGGGKMFDKLTHDRGVETESGEFHKKYVLRVVDDQDDIALFELFSTTFLDGLATDPSFEVDGQRVEWEQVRGSLLVYIRQHQHETADLDALVAAGARIYQRYCEEHQ